MPCAGKKMPESSSVLRDVTVKHVPLQNSGDFSRNHAQRRKSIEKTDAVVNSYLQQRFHRKSASKVSCSTVGGIPTFVPSDKYDKCMGKRLKISCKRGITENADGEEKTNMASPLKRRRITLAQTLSAARRKVLSKLEESKTISSAGKERIEKANTSAELKGTPTSESASTSPLNRSIDSQSAISAGSFAAALLAATSAIRNSPASNGKSLIQSHSESLESDLAQKKEYAHVEPEPRGESNGVGSEHEAPAWRGGEFFGKPSSDNAVESEHDDPVLTGEEHFSQPSSAAKDTQALQPDLAGDTATSTKIRFDMPNVLVTSVEVRNGNDESAYAVYHLAVSQSRTDMLHFRSSVCRRFSEFAELHSRLYAALDETERRAMPKLPPKTFFRCLDSQFLKSRKEKLQKFISNMVRFQAFQDNHDLLYFISGQNNRECESPTLLSWGCRGHSTSRTKGAFIV